METEPWLKVSSDRLVKLGIELSTPGLQGEQFIHYTMVAPIRVSNSVDPDQDQRSSGSKLFAKVIDR